MNENQETDTARQQRKRIQEAHDAFLRWQDVRRAQFGYVVNLMLTLTTASLAFGVKLILDKPSLGVNGMFRCSSYVLMAAIGFALLTNLSRLCDFRYTALSVRGRELRERQKANEPLENRQLEKAKKRRKYRKCADALGRITWWFLTLQLLTFGSGIGLLVCGVNQSLSATSDTSHQAGRFVNLDPGDDSVLLDTATGEWCSPWIGETGKRVNSSFRSCKDVR